MAPSPSATRLVRGEMKEQYAGDENDYRKYALLRHFAEAGVRIGVCWMLTRDDGSPDGALTKYLEREPLCDDEKLFEHLKQLGKPDIPRRLHSIERKDVVPRAIFFDEFLSDRAGLRRAFFEAAFEHLGRADLIFFDPDNGLATPSIPKGKPNSSKYIYRDEIHDAYHAGHSVLVYQHFAHETRAAYIDRIGSDLLVCASAARLWCFWTPRTAFFLLAHPRHAKQLAAAAELACGRWNSSFIKGKRLLAAEPEGNTG
jgi:hypothetical protein